MAGTDQPPKDVLKKGFAGLSSLVSDVDAAITDAPKKASARPARPSTSDPSATPRAADPAQPTHRPPIYSPRPIAGDSSRKKALIGFGVFVAVMVAMVGMVFSVDGSKTSATSQPRSLAYTPSSTPTRPTEERPPFGQDKVLAGAQLRYCVAEKIRLDASEFVVNNFNEAHVDRFNAYVDDYNNRCGRFRYREGSLQDAERAIEPYRKQLAAEGRSRIVGSAPRGTNRPDSGVAITKPQPRKRVPDPTVLAVQQRLNQLGYAAGKADGYSGLRTVEAIRKFQAARGLTPDGRPTELLLLQLDAVAGTASAPVRSTTPSSIFVASSVTGRSTSPAEAPGMPSDPSALLAQISVPERESLESACSSDKYIRGPAAYHTCVSRQLAALAKQGSRPSLSALSSVERESIESVCSSAKYIKGPAAYNACLSSQLHARNAQGSAPDISRLSRPERESIESACSSAKYIKGPAAYNACLESQLAALARQGGRPSLVGMSSEERESIESACSTAKYTKGPAAYNACLSSQLMALNQLPQRANLTPLSATDRDSIKSACSSAKYTQGPAAYNTCLLRQLAQL